MTERTCGECYRCCVVFGIRELKKHQDQSCRHLDGRNPTARCSIYANRPKACQAYLCLWRDGEFDEDDRPDKSGIIARVDRLDSEKIQLVVTLDDETSIQVKGLPDTSDETLRRVQEWAADKPIHQILYRFVGTNQMAIAARDGGTAQFTYIPVDYEGLQVVKV